MLQTTLFITSFGEDEHGEILVAAADGVIYRLVSTLSESRYLPILQLLLDSSSYQKPGRF
jgi:hypothetical protein